MNAFAAATGNKLAMRPIASLLWTLVILFLPELRVEVRMKINDTRRVTIIDD